MDDLTVDVAPEVRRLCRGRELERLIALAHQEGYRCVACRRLDRPSGLNRASVIAAEHVDGANLMMAHRACLPSGIVVLSGSVHGDDAAAADDATSWTLTAITDHGAKALLCMEVPGRAGRALLPSGDIEDQVLNLLLTNGWTLVTSIQQIVDLPLLDPAWVLEVDPTGTGQALAPMGLLLSGVAYEPAWADLALGAGDITMLVGHLAPSGEQLDTLAALDEAIVQGSAVGARLQTRRST
jgi:hypothetical protein